MSKPFPKGGTTHTAFPSHFPVCTTGILSPPTVCRDFVWPQTGWLANPMVLINRALLNLYPSASMPQCPTLPVQVHLSHFDFYSMVYLLFRCSTVARFGGMVSVYVAPLKQCFLYRQQSLATMWQPRWVNLCAAGRFASTDVDTPPRPGCLPLPMSQYRDRVLVTFLIQQSPDPARWLSLLQTDLIHLFLQQFLQLVI